MNWIPALEVAYDFDHTIREESPDFMFFCLPAEGHHEERFRIFPVGFHELPTQALAFSEDPPELVVGEVFTGADAVAITGGVAADPPRPPSLRSPASPPATPSCAA